MTIKIRVDAGHGSNTAGKRTPPMPSNLVDATGKLLAAKGEQIREHQANIQVAYYLTYYLQKYGFEVIKTGWRDVI